MRWTVWTSLAMLPASALLVFAGSVVSVFIGLIYLSSMVVAMGYHWYGEKRFVEVDHVLAWAVIVSNCIMCLESREPLFSTIGIGFVCIALGFFRAARRYPQFYALSHSLWHVACGAAGWCFALGYLG